MTYNENSHNVGNIFGTFIAESNKSIIFTFDMTSHAFRRTAHPGRSSSFYIIALIGLADKKAVDTLLSYLLLSIFHILPYS